MFPKEIPKDKTTYLASIWEPLWSSLNDSFIRICPISLEPALLPSVNVTVYKYLLHTLGQRN